MGGEASADGKQTDEERAWVWRHFYLVGLGRVWESRSYEGERGTERERKEKEGKRRRQASIIITGAIRTYSEEVHTSMGMQFVVKDSYRDAHCCPGGRVTPARQHNDSLLRKM